MHRKGILVWLLIAATIGAALWLGLGTDSSLPGHVPAVPRASEQPADQNLIEAGAAATPHAERGGDPPADLVDVGQDTESRAERRTIEAASPFSVRVVSAGGQRVAGARVEFTVGPEQTRPRDESTTTDAQGLAAPTTLFLRWIRRRSIDSCTAVVHPPLVSARRFTVPLDDPDAPPFELRLAEHASLLIEFEDFDADLLEGTTLTLDAVRHEPWEFPRSAPVTLWTGTVGASGQARVQPIEPGREYRLSASIDHGQLNWEHEFTCPLITEPVPVVRIPAPQIPRGTVTLQNPDGSPYAHGRLLVWYDDHPLSSFVAGRRSTDQFQRTDARGRLVIALQGGPPPQHLDFMTEQGGRARAVVAVEPTGAIDLGTHRLVTTPRLASGTVVDSAGAPVAGATVTLELRDPKTVSRAAAQDEAPPATTTDSHGRFVLFGVAQPAGSELTFEHPRFCPVRLPLDSNDLPLEVTLYRAARVHCQLAERLQPHASELEIVLAEVDGDSIGRVRETAAVLSSQSRSLTFLPVAPGRLTVLARRKTDAAVLARSAPLEVREGNSVSFGVLDFDPTPHLFTFRVVDTAGNPPAHGYATLFVGDEQFQVRMENGIGRALVSGIATTVWITGAELTTTSFTAVPNGATLTVRPAARLTLRLPRGVNIPRGVKLTVVLRDTTDQTSHPAFHRTRPWPAHGSRPLVITIYRRVEYAAELWLQRDLPDLNAQSSGCTGSSHSLARDSLIFTDGTEQLEHVFRFTQADLDRIAATASKEDAQSLESWRRSLGR